MSDNGKQTPEQPCDSASASDSHYPGGFEWQITFDAVADVVFVLDRNFHILRCNKAAIDFLGLPRDKIEGRLCWELMHGSNKPHDGCPIITMLASRRREKSIIPMRGGHFEITADPILDSAGEITGVVHIISDVTGRMDTLREIKEAQLLCQDIIDNQSAGMYRILCLRSGNWADVNNPPFKYEFINERYSEITGLTMEELLLDPSATMKLVHPEDLDSWIFLNQKADSTLEIFKWEGRFVVNGEVKWIHYESRPRVLANGDRVWTGVLLDTTELKDTCEELLKTETVLRRISSNLNSGMIYRVLGFPDGGRKFTYLGGAVEKFYGVSAEEVMADPGLLYGRVHPEEKERLKLLEEEAYRSSSVFKAVVRMINPDGSIRWSSFTSSPASLPDGSTCWDGIETDITELKHAEEERLILEDNLRHAEKMQAVGHLAGGIAHDFNNQLMGIMGYAEMIFNKSADPGIKEFATNILSASRRSSDLTRKLLAFSRKGKYNAVAVDVHELIAEVVKILEHSIDRKIKINQELRAGNRVISGDPTQIQNALLNLAINARDAMPDGGELSFETGNVHMEDVPKLRHEHRSAKGSCIKICVRDNGHGMDNETMKHVFEPFFSTKPADKGSGMGLASVYGTVKSHKGYVYAESELGKGSCFCVFLPLADAPATVGAVQTKQEAAANKSLRILLADDDQVVRKMLSGLMTAIGHTVTVARDGAEAVEIYKSSYPEIDLVLLDMVMPRMSGKEAFLKMQKINAGIKALMISGFSIDGEVQQLLKAGMKGFLQKPFQMSVLSQKISEVLAS